MVAHMITRIDPDSVALNPAPITTGIGVAAIMNTTEVAPGCSTGLLAIASHITGAPVPIATDATILTSDLHLIGIPPKMTADLTINPINITDHRSSSTS